MPGKQEGLSTADLRTVLLQVILSVFNFINEQMNLKNTFQCLLIWIYKWKYLIDDSGESVTLNSVFFHRNLSTKSCILCIQLPEYPEVW
jgi:hypothetical protein